LAGWRPAARHAPCLAEPTPRVVRLDEVAADVLIWDTAWPPRCSGRTRSGDEGGRGRRWPERALLAAPDPHDDLDRPRPGRACLMCTSRLSIRGVRPEDGGPDDGWAGRDPVRRSGGGGDSVESYSRRGRRQELQPEGTTPRAAAGGGAGCRGEGGDARCRGGGGSAGCRDSVFLGCNKRLGDSSMGPMCHERQKTDDC
jgi:hypothetical protein